MGFERCPVSPYLYRYVLEDNYLYTTIHVDDGLMMADSEDTVDHYIEKLKTYISFDLKLFSPVQKFLGMQIEEDENYIYIYTSDKLY
jgi:hypothetical protein